MVDLDILDAMGSTQERLREIFTAQAISTEERAKFSEEEVSKLEKDFGLRKKFEGDINRRFSEQINYALENYQMYSSIDVAWDAAPINKETYPLMLYAQGRLDLGKCAKALKDLPNVDSYVTKNDKGEPVAINIPKFFEVNFNLVRSVISRRLAAQVNKYNSLYPYFKYEPRSTSQVGKVRADVLSQVMDIMTDQFDLRHHDAQVYRDAMLYGHCVDFVRARWEKEEQIIFDPSENPEFVTDKTRKKKTVITKEGVGFLNPHPSRIFWDNAYPLSAINTDTGPEFIGFWDVIRYGDIAENPQFWNRTTITYSATIVQLFSTYAQYFSQYYCTITPPCDLNTLDLSAKNDRLNNLGLYAQDMLDSSMIIANYYRKIIPKDWGIGDYPFPVWLRMLVAGDKTVIYAEFLPSTPAAYLGINENDARQLNISIAMELLPYQDQMTQLLSALMLAIQSCHVKVLALDIDGLEPDMVKRFREEATGKARYQPVHVIEYSGIKMREAGVDMRRVVELVQTQPGNIITELFQAISQLVQLSERLMALSPHELGQPAPREISATETNMMAGTTETVYGFISDAIDEFRAAKKRILYESYMVCGKGNFHVPIVNRYTKKTIEKAGFEIVEEDNEVAGWKDESEPNYHTVIGTKSKLLYDYIFTSRDGALRAVNTQAANALVQLLNVLKDPMVMQALTKEKYFEIVNEIFRLSGASVDLNLELEEGDTNNIGPDKQAQIEQTLKAIVDNLQQERQVVAQLGQAQQQMGQKFEELLNVVKELTQKVDELDKKPTSVEVDPMKFIQGQMTVNEKRQKMRHAEESHVADLALKSVKALSMGNGEGNGRSAYSK